MLLAACSVDGQVGDEGHLWAVRRTPAENPVQGGWVRSARDWRGRARWQGQDAGGTPALPGDAVRLRGGGDVWRALVAGIVFQHVSMKSLLREMDRTPALLDVCGFDPLPRLRSALRHAGGGNVPETS